MTKNEKAVISAKDYGSNTDLKNELTAHNNNPNQFQLQAETQKTRRSSFESTRLSRLPKLSNRPKFELPTKAAVCVGCGGKLDPDDTIQQSVKSCRKCLGIYARVETAFDDASLRKRRQLLEKFAEVE